MALSNWDTLAFDSDGNPCGGALKTPFNIGCEIYKNWLYVHSPTMWQDGGAYPRDVIAEVQHGELQIGCLKIWAARHDDQNSIFVMSESVEYSKDFKNNKYHRMAGIGCYGFVSSEWVGVKPETVRAFAAWLKTVADRDYFSKVDFGNALRFN